MNKRILIVDDETNVRLNFRTTLESEGYEVFDVSSGEGAVQSLAEHTFALAILDIRNARNGRIGIAGKDERKRN
jgi:DNA-binding NtrC family response regulator